MASPLYSLQDTQQLLKMGQLLENIQQHSRQHSPKEMPLNLEEYAPRENAGAVMRHCDGSLCYLYSKDLQQTNKKEEMAYGWLNNNYNHSCNINRYEIKSKSLLCGSHVSIKAVMEYGDTSLAEILGEREGREGQEGEEGVRFETPLELLGFIKLMIDVVQEQREKNKVWVGFHTKNIMYFTKSKAFKFFYLFSLDDSNYNEQFFAPETAPGMETSERETVFSMGMVLLCLFLKEDCSDCYNYQNHTFCESIFQDKIEKMKEKMITKGLLGILEDQSQYVTQFDEQVSEFILLMTEKGLDRLSFPEVKKRYLWLIRKASFGFRVNNEQHTRSILQPLTSKRFDRQKRKVDMRANIACFSSKEQVHFKTTFTQIEDSDLFTISRSHIQNRKGKENHTLKWKKAITKRMKEQKENLPYYQQV